MNLRNDRTNHEKTLAFSRIEVRAVRNTVLDNLYSCGHESMELADAGSLWVAPHHLLAGVGTPDS